MQNITKVYIRSLKLFTHCGQKNTHVQQHLNLTNRNTNIITRKGRVCLVSADSITFFIQNTCMYYQEKHPLDIKILELRFHRKILIMTIEY